MNLEDKKELKELIKSANRERIVEDYSEEEEKLKKLEKRNNIIFGFILFLTISIFSFFIAKQNSDYNKIVSYNQQNFKNNKTLYCNIFIVSKKTGWEIITNNGLDIKFINKEKGVLEYPSTCKIKEVNEFN